MSNARIDNNLLFHRLFTFIKKNTAIWDFLASIEADNSKLEKTKLLLSAIQSADSDSPIFDDEHCHLYLLYLIKENHIFFWQGMTIYFYIMALMQFTMRQPLPADMKNLRKIKVECLSKDGKLTKEGEHYLEGVAYFLTGEKTLFAELKEFALSLPPAEQWLINIPYKDADNQEYPFDRQINQLISSNSVPFIFEAFSGKQRFTYVFPSFSIIIFCLRKISPDYIDPFVAFGSISSDSLAKLHKDGKHPLPIYSPYVKTNLLKVHDFNSGPFGAAIHDLAHISFGSSLPLLFRQKIYNDYNLCFMKMKNHAKMFSDEETIKTIDDILTQLNDFDLIDIPVYFRSEENRCAKYFSMCFRPNEARYYYNGFLSYIGANERYDRLYYLIEYFRHNEAEQNENVKFWEQASKTTQELVDGSRKSMDDIYISTSLRVLAKNAEDRTKALSLPPQSTKYIAWQAWLDILNSTTDSKKIWDMLIDKHDKELLFLIDRCNLLFFHPYLPLTHEKRLQLIEFVKNSMENEKVLKKNEEKVEKPSVASQGLYARPSSIISNSETKRERCNFRCNIL